MARPGSSEKLGRVSCALEHQNEMCTRGATSPRSASPIGPAPTRDPRIALPPAMSTYSCQAKRARTPRPTTTVNHTSATPTVIRSRLRSATELPPSELDMPPPNMSDRPPPLPLCSRMSRVRNRPVMTRRTWRPIFTASTSNPSCGVGGNRSSISVRVPEGGQPGVEQRSGRLQVGTEPADRGELDGVDRRPADEGAVDVLLGHDRRDVAGLHRAAVEHPDAVGHVAAVELGELGADRRADLLGVLGRGDLTGADRPDR